MSYRNNLKKDDRVQHAETKRLGNVAMQPREATRFVAIQWQGNNGHVYEDVDKLRLVMGEGQVDEEPPYDGMLPEKQARATRAPKPAAAPGAKEENPAVAALKERLAVLNEEMQVMNEAYRVRLAEKKRLEQALDVLEPTTGDGT